MTNHTPKFYQMMDDAGLNAANINGTRLPLSKVINAIRTQLAVELQAYVEKIEESNKE